jgi:integrase
MPNSQGRRRRFGTVRKLPSGQWQARYRGPDGLMYPADTTFPTKTGAEVWLTRKEAEILDGDWINPEAGKVLLTDFAAAWIDERPNLRPNTVLLYSYLLRRHITPHFTARTVGEIKEAHVRRWRRKLLDSGVSEVTTAKAYRLLKAILNTAADDEIIRRNPCRIKGAGQEDSAERPVLTIPQLYSLADAIDQRYRLLVLLAAFTSLRWSELAALRPSDIDLETCTIRVHRQLIEQPGGGSAFGPTKSKAGKRTVSFPPMLCSDLREHLQAKQRPDVLMFTSPAGMPLRHRNFRRRVWLLAVAKAELQGVHFHDLRHTGNALTADEGANLRELMERMGHSSMRAALIYQHSSAERQRKLAEAVGETARAALRRAEQAKNVSGTDVARSQEDDLDS